MIYIYFFGFQLGFHCGHFNQIKPFQALLFSYFHFFPSQRPLWKINVWRKARKHKSQLQVFNNFPLTNGSCEMSFSNKLSAFLSLFFPIMYINDIFFCLLSFSFFPLGCGTNSWAEQYS